MMTENRMALERMQENPVRRIARVLYYFVVVSYCLGWFLQVLNWNYTYPGMAELGVKIRDVARIAALFLMLEKFNRSVSKGFISLAILVVSFAYYLFTDSWGPTDLVFFYTISDLADEKTMPRILLLMYSAFAIILVVFGISGAVKDTVIHFSYRDGHSLGFGHPNTLGVFLFSLVVLLRLTVLRKNNWIFVFVCLGIAVFSWFYSASRTTVVLLILYPFLVSILEYLKKRGWDKPIQLFKYLPVVIAIACVAISAYIAFVKPIGGTDGSMMARFEYPAVILRENGFTFFGTILNLHKPYDCSYLFVLIRHGVLWTVFLIAFLTVVMRLLVKKRRTEYIAVFALFLLQGVMENTMLVPYYNIIPFFALAIGNRPEDGLIHNVNRNRILRIVLTLVVAVSCAVSMLLVHDPKLSDVYFEKSTYSYTSASSPVRDDASLSQSITVPKSLGAVRMYMATGGVIPTGEYTLALLDENHTILESHQIPNENIQDWRMMEVIFDNNYPAGKYTIQLSGINTMNDYVMIFQNDENPYPDGEAYIGDIPTESDWMFEYAYRVEKNTWLYRWIILVLCLMIAGFIWFL